MFRNVFRRKTVVIDEAIASASSSMTTVAEESFCCVRMQPIQDILGYVRPQFQRMVNQGHVESLMKDIHNDWQHRGGLSVLQSVSVAEMPDGSHYILDGSHRMMAFSRLIGQIPMLVHQVLPVVVYRCRTHEEVLHWYARINHHLPIHPMELELAWADKVKPLLEHLQRRYRVYLSKSQTPQCPNFHLPSVQTALQERAQQLQEEAITAAGLVEDVDALHREMTRRWSFQLTMNPRLAKCKAKQPEDPCFLGYWKHGEWIDLILYRRLHGLVWETIDWTMFDGKGCTTARRPTIPKAVRRQVWGKCNVLDHMQGFCYICKEPLHFDDMECAHDVPHCLGGTSSIDNLWPACRMCNRDMGIRRLSEYRALVQQIRS